MLNRLVSSKRIRFFRAERFLLALGGISLNEDVGILFKIYSVLCLYIFTYGFSIMIALDVLIQDFSEAIDSWVMVIAAIMIGALTYATQKYRVKLGILLHRLEREPFLPNRERGGDEEAKMMEECFSQLIMQSVALVIGVIITLLSQYAYTTYLRLFADSSQWSIGFIHFASVNTSYSPNFEILWMYQNISLNYMCCVICAVSLIITGVSTIITTQFRMLQNNLRRLLSNSQEQMLQDSLSSNIPGFKEADPTRIPWKYLEKSIKQIVDYHLEIIDVTHELDSIYNNAILVVFVTTLIIICFELYRIATLETSDPRTSRIFGEMVTASLHSIMICYSGEQMAYESQKVATVAFETNFIGSDLRFQRSLIMIIQRSQRPLRIKAGKILDASLMTLVWILRTSYSAFMMLRKLTMNE